MNFPFYLFAGIFNDAAEAENFAFEKWENEPGPHASDEEYQKWEDRNPTWILAEELEFYMDSDFVELTTDLNYITSLIDSPEEKLLLQEKNLSTYSHYIIVTADAIYGDRREKSNTDDAIREPSSTKTLD